ncbi:sugar-binding protein [Kallotenue papyrolyticum]|uniref:sugar-binding protein n=1 Tax=Kallotenue papyrolyticum TaxID=1325125 RepID=UPI00047862AE|nr:sugar-binding protein [Kallotenue papyrolyticum]
MAQQMSRREFLRWLALSGGVVLGGQALVGCGTPGAGSGGGSATSPAGSPAAGGAGRPLTFVWSPKATNNPVFDTARVGAMDKAKELGITVEWVGPAEADAQRQAQLLDDVINRGVDGIGLSCNDPDALKPTIDRAVDRGIPVITWDSDSPQSKRLTFYSQDNTKAAQKAAELFIQFMQDSPNKTYAILTGVPGAQNLEERIKAFRAVVDPAGFELVAIDPCYDDIQRGIEVVENRMAANPDLGGWFMAGAWPLFGDINAMPKLLANKGKTKIVAWDTLPAQLQLVKDGLVQALIGQKYYGWGYDAVGILYDIVVNKKQYPPFVDSGFDVVDSPQKADEFLKKWETNDWR